MSRALRAVPFEPLIWREAAIVLDRCHGAQRARASHAAVAASRRAAGLRRLALKPRPLPPCFSAADDVDLLFALCRRYQRAVVAGRKPRCRLMEANLRLVVTLASRSYRPGQGIMKLPQFRGHLFSWRGGGGVHDAEVETAVRGGIPTADGRAGSVRTYTRRPRSLRRRRFAARNGLPAQDLSRVSGQRRRSARRGRFSAVGEPRAEFGPRGPQGPPEAALRVHLSPLRASCRASYAAVSTCRRLTLRARHTKSHSHRAFASPRRLKRRKPSTCLIQP